MTDFHEITETEVLKLCKAINTNKSLGIAGIEIGFFKDCMLCSIPQVTFLYNMILATNIIPLSWKQASIVPIFKSGLATDISNYRPISLLPQIVKTFVKILHERILNFINENNLMNKEQGGFLPLLGINDTIGEFMGEIYNISNRGEPTLYIFFDLKKAFDTIDHKILLTKLELMGFQGNVFDLLSNYLSYRTHLTKVNGVLSNACNMTCEVPQGSTLGPLLFILYINDLPKCIDNIGIKLYADDTFYINSIITIVLANSVMVKVADKFFKWCLYNKLTININKSKCMFFSNKLPRVHNKIKEGINICINSIKLEIVQNYKYLGIILDEHLYFEKHVNYLISIISHRLYTLRKIRQYINEETALLLYKTMVLSYFDLGDIFYNSCKKSCLNKLQILQNNALRCIFLATRNSGITVQEMHKKAGLLILEQRRQLNQCAIAHKYSIEQFKFDHVRNPSLRSSTRINLAVPRPNQCFEKCFVYSSIKTGTTYQKHLNLYPNMS